MVERVAIQTNADVAGKVRGVTAEKGQKQAHLVPILNLSNMAVSRRFRGETPFTPEELITLARHFDVAVGVFFGEPARA